MKKVTMSAAVLALALMGCSDAGLDNSVASTSTNEVKSEKTSPILAKSIYYDYNNVIYNNLGKMIPTGGNTPLVGNVPNNDGFERYVYQEAGIVVQMQTRVDLDWDGYEGQGEFFVVTENAPNTILVVTTIVSDCDDNGYCLWPVTNTAYKVNENVRSVLLHTNPNGHKLSFWKNGDDVGAVSAFVSVWNQGTPYEFVTMAATYNGGLFKKKGQALAKKVYDRYILKEVRNKLFK